jgi:hypothetical protein
MRLVSRNPRTRVVLWFFEIAGVLVCFDHIARFTTNANHGIM